MSWRQARERVDARDHQRQQQLDVLLNVLRVELEEEHDDQRALDEHFERVSAPDQHARLGFVAVQAAEAHLLRRRGRRGRSSRRRGLDLGTGHRRGRHTCRRRLRLPRAHEVGPEVGRDHTLEVMVQRAHEVQEGLRVGVECRSVVLMQVEDDPQTDQRVLLVVCVEYVHGQAQQIGDVLAQRLVVRQPVEDLQQHVPQLLVRAVLELRRAELQDLAQDWEESLEKVRVLRRVHDLDRVAYLRGRAQSRVGALGLRCMGRRQRRG